MGKKICIVVTSADKMAFKDGSGEMPTGLWCEEAAAPYMLFKEAGHEVCFASPKGGKITMDEGSMKGDFFTEKAQAFMKNEDAQKLLHSSIPLADFEKDCGSYDAIFLSGGHGTCTDFVDNATLKSVLEKMAADGKVLAAVCHGPVGLLNVMKDGKPIVEGHPVAAFTDAEEGPNGVGLHEKVPFSLEGKMKELGAKFEGSDPWSSKVCCSGKLVTGQNPQSSEACAVKVMECLA